MNPAFLGLRYCSLIIFLMFSRAFMEIISVESLLLEPGSNSSNNVHLNSRF